jgi:hypothetical protein
MSAAANNFFFAKKEWPMKVQNVLYNVLLLSFEPDWNPAGAHADLSSVTPDSLMSSQYINFKI